MTQGTTSRQPDTQGGIALWPKIETIKALATYGIAGYVVWATLDTLRYMVSLDPAVFGVAAIGIISILATGVVTFLFGVETGKQQQINTQRAFESGINVTPIDPPPPPAGPPAHPPPPPPAHP